MFFNLRIKIYVTVTPRSMFNMPNKSACMHKLLVLQWKLAYWNLVIRILWLSMSSASNHANITTMVTSLHVQKQKWCIKILFAVT